MKSVLLALAGVIAFSIGTSVRRNLMLMFEEIVLQNLVGELKNHPDGFTMQVHMEYPEDDAGETLKLCPGRSGIHTMETIILLWRYEEAS